jgi:hypothetical protein
MKVELGESQPRNSKHGSFPLGKMSDICNGNCIGITTVPVCGVVGTICVVVLAAVVVFGVVVLSGIPVVVATGKVVVVIFGAEVVLVVVVASDVEF